MKKNLHFDMFICFVLHCLFLLLSIFLVAYRLLQLIIHFLCSYD
jgi:hypothetical protein